jgi:multidrug efflux pump subunit AcrA (membrane-fusion protein)
MAAAPSASPEGGVSPPPIGTPQKPLTEETAMPPVLPLGWKAPEPAGAVLTNGHGNLPASELPTTVGPAPSDDEPAAADRAARPAPGPTPIVPLRTVDATIPDRAPVPVPALAPPLATVPARAPRRSLSPLVYAALGLVTAGALSFFFFRSATTPEPKVLAVRTIVPTSGSVYRWFDAVGTVKPGGEHTLSFVSGGKVAKVLPPGSTFHPGDIIAELESARRYKSELSHHTDRLAHYEKTLETARAAGDRPEARQAEIKVAEKKRLMSDTQAKLAREAVIATGAGEIAETVVTVGATVKPGAAAARTKGTEWRAELELSREDADRLRQLGFCHAEIDGKPLDCSLSADGGDETHVAIDLPADAAVTAGKPVRVARARFDGVFVLPASALVPSKGPDHRVYVARDGHAESTAVILVDQSATDVVVSQGLEPGSAVIVDVPPDLRPRAAVRAVEVKK